MISTKCIKRRFHLYNTLCEVVIFDCREDIEEILDNVEQISIEVQELLNIYDINSELSKLNNNYKLGVWYKVSNKLFGFLEILKNIHEMSEKTFDPTIGNIVKLWDFTSNNPKLPSKEEINDILENTGFEYVEFNSDNCSVRINKNKIIIDAGGAGKGYAVELVVNYLKSCGIKSASVNFGGNLFVIGKHRDDYNEIRDWEIGIQDPWELRGKGMGKILCSDKGLATSAGYERYFIKNGKVYHHLIDPKTGYPSQSEFQSVTIISNSAFYTDLISTPFYILGEKRGRKLIEKLEKNIWIGFIAIKNDGSVITSNNVKPFFNSF